VERFAPRLGKETRVVPLSIVIHEFHSINPAAQIPIVILREGKDVCIWSARRNSLDTSLATAAPSEIEGSRASGA
jgi:hypothetical protein